MTAAQPEGGQTTPMNTPTTTAAGEQEEVPKSRYVLLRLAKRRRAHTAPEKSRTAAAAASVAVATTHDGYTRAQSYQPPRACGCCSCQDLVAAGSNAASHSSHDSHHHQNHTRSEPTSIRLARRLFGRMRSTDEDPVTVPATTCSHHHQQTQLHPLPQHSSSHKGFGAAADARLKLMLSKQRSWSDPNVVHAHTREGQEWLAQQQQQCLQPSLQVPDGAFARLRSHSDRRREDALAVASAALPHGVLAADHTVSTPTSPVFGGATAAADTLAERNEPRSPVVAAASVTTTVEYVKLACSAKPLSSGDDSKHSQQQQVNGYKRIWLFRRRQKSKVKCPGTTTSTLSTAATADSAVKTAYI